MFFFKKKARVQGSSVTVLAIFVGGCETKIRSFVLWKGDRQRNKLMCEMSLCNAWERGDPGTKVGGERGFGREDRGKESCIRKLFNTVHKECDPGGNVTKKKKKRKSWIRFEGVCCTGGQGTKVGGKEKWVSETELRTKSSIKKTKSLLCWFCLFSW